jgi:hypothetical protein
MARLCIRPGRQVVFLAFIKDMAGKMIFLKKFGRGSRPEARAGSPEGLQAASSVWDRNFSRKTRTTWGSNRVPAWSRKYALTLSWGQAVR